MEGHVEILKSLVDTLTMQLTNILVKIESINPVLNRLLDESDNGNQISNSTLEKVKELKNNFDNYHQSMIELPATLERIRNIESDIKKNSTDILNLETSVSSVNTTLKETLEILKNIETNLKPVTKFSKFIMKPMGAVLFLLTTAGCITGIVEAVKFYFGK